MFVRVKKSGNYKYLQIVQTYREGKKVKQRVVSTLGRLDFNPGYKCYQQTELFDTTLLCC